jgi:creatinine amidohydrolase
MADNVREVRYERLRPADIVKAREAAPVAYLPIGTIEWHGRHNPIGLDTVKIHRLAMCCAQETGGLVFPALFYGEPREEGLMEANAADRDKIAEVMHLPAKNFSPGYMRFSPQEAVLNYQRLLLHCLYELQSLGFKVVVIAAGHYPLLDHARAAASLFHQARWDNKRDQAIPWVFTGYELVQDKFPGAGDHAGHWETSLMLALEGDLVDLSELPDDPAEPLVGVGTARPVPEASAEYGNQAIRLIVERVAEQVNLRLHQPDQFRAHGLQL